MNKVEHLWECQTRQDPFLNLESSSRRLVRLTKEFIEKDTVERPWHLHITIQPRYYDRWDDGEMKELIRHTEYLLCKRFIKGHFEKYCLEDRFHGRVFFESEKNTKERHCHIVFYIPFHMLSRKTEDGWHKLKGSRLWKTEVVRQAFISSYITAYPKDRETLWRYRKSFTNKDGTVNSYRKEENMRLRMPYVQVINHTKKDVKNVVGYDMKESHIEDRLNDIFFTNNNKAVTH